MDDYRFYLIGSSGRIVRGLDVRCEDDTDAIAQATARQDPAIIEIWQGRRLVGSTPGYAATRG